MRAPTAPLHSRGLSSLEALLTASSPTSANKARAESRFTRLSRARVPSRKQASQGRQITSPKTRGGQQRTSPREKHEDYDLTRSATERARPAGRAPSPRKRVTGPTRSRAPPRTSSRAARATASWRCRRWRAAPCKMQVPVARQRCENCPHQFISNAAPDRGAGAGAGAWPQIWNG